MIANARPPARRPELPRWCRCDNDQPKKAFETRREARAYGKRVWPDRRFRQYQCRACGWYHNTTDMRRAA